MTRRQAADKAQQLADAEDSVFVVMSSSRRAFVYPLSDIDFTMATGNVIIVAPRGRFNGMSAAQIVEAAR